MDKTGGRAEGGRILIVELLFWSDRDGRHLEWVHQRDSESVFDSLKKKPERSDSDGLDMYRGRSVHIE